MNTNKTGEQEFSVFEAGGQSRETARGKDIVEAAKNFLEIETRIFEGEVASGMKKCDISGIDGSKYKLVTAFSECGVVLIVSRKGAHDFIVKERRALIK